MKRIALLGSTGSIGTQALDVIARHPGEFTVTALAADRNASLLQEQIGRFLPSLAGLRRPPDRFQPQGKLQWELGEDAAERVAAQCEADLVLVAVVGVCGLKAVLACLRRGVGVLLANKETLVAGGELVMRTARERGAALLPVDSEHSAIFQCLQGQPNGRVARLVLTASGGPFRTWSAQRMEKATLEDALRHPNWSMGRKITVDSATMMNKALEVIEARHLFGVEPARIQVAVHPQSIVHSAVEFVDGALLAQLGQPDMRVPIQYALSYPDRLPLDLPRLDLQKLGTLTFEAPDLARFPALRLGYEALAAGGTAPAALNGANEAAVERFLQGEIPFPHIAQAVEEALCAVPRRPAERLEDILEADRAAREAAEAALRK